MKEILGEGRTTTEEADVKFFANLLLMICSTYGSVSRAFLESAYSANQYRKKIGWNIVRPKDRILTRSNHEERGWKDATKVQYKYNGEINTSHLPFTDEVMGNSLS